MKTFLTFDYELYFSNRSGSVSKCIIEPVDELMKISSKYSIPLIFFVDAGYLIKLKEFSQKYPRVAADYELVKRQLHTISEQSHDIQLHIHPHWENTNFDGTEWRMDTSMYRLHQFPKSDIERIVSEYTNVLQGCASNPINTYRAGGWCVQPFSEIKSSLKKAGIYIDSSVFAGGYLNSSTHYFDFRKMPNKEIWRFDEDVCSESKMGGFVEYAISSFRLPPHFYLSKIFRDKITRLSEHKSFGDGVGIGASKLEKIKMILNPSFAPVSFDGYKSQYVLGEAIRSLQSGSESFVVLSHPKSLTPFSLGKFDKFIQYSKGSDFKRFSQIKIDE